MNAGDGCKKMYSTSKGHYREIAEHYDALWEPYLTSRLPHIQEALQLKPDDALVDIGGGTGWYAHQLWKAAGLKVPVVCVDSSPEMLEVARRLEGVTTVQAAAEDFFSQTRERQFSKALMSAVFHHFKDPAPVLSGIWKSLKPGGCLVMETRDPQMDDVSDGTFFRAAEAVNASGLKFRSTGDITSLIETSAPFKVQKKFFRLELKIPKTQWYQMLRGRYLSSMQTFSDEEIEEGIAELERERFSTLKDDDIITKIDEHLLIVAKKLEEGIFI